jgi:hypothetical protein
MTGPAAYLLQVEALDLGADVKAVGLELTDPANAEPVRGPDAARVWGASLTALAAPEPWALDFFSHLDRVRAYCTEHGIGFREAAQRCIVVPAPESAGLVPLFERFEDETFGARAGGLVLSSDAALEGDLSRRGVDAYHHVFANYHFCAVCDFENGFLTLLTAKLWASEVLRRLRAPLDRLAVDVVRPQ